MFDKLPGRPAAENAMRSAAALFGYHPVKCIQKLSTQELFSNQVAQPLIGALQLATWAELREKVPVPRVFAGYSVGELAAYGCAGALGIEETLTLMLKRAELMDDASSRPSGLLALRGLDRVQVESLCRATGVEIAINNGLDHFVVGGDDVALTQCQTHPLCEKATTIKRLQVTVPSHTSLLASAGRKFAAVLRDSSLKDPESPVLAGVSGAVVRKREQAIAALVQQLSNPLNWLACMQTAIEMGCKVFLELGPGDALAKMLRETFPTITVRSVDEFRTLQGVSAWVTKQCHESC
jgi:[acyl-carrier-protein] S-malonyltransferase